ncbi:LamG-like jellyroll fold domain-containing protein [Longimonas halophila]|nr:LamG-like jellyroll fold domain-containing protein [Longimonas halophila]
MISRLRPIAVDEAPRARSYRATIGAAAALLSLMLIGFITPQHATAQQVIYVTESGSGSGTSWSDATDLSSALSSATSSDVVVIAAGTYQPSERLDAGDSRTATFEVTGDQDGLGIYGGWSGTESFSGIADVEAQLDSRDLQANETVLSGDLDQNDGPDTDGDGFPDSGRADNAYHVFVFNGGSEIGSSVSANVTPATVLNGVTVTGGSANGSFPDSAGGGLLCDGRGSGNECSPQIANATFTENSATLGGAIYNRGRSGTSSPQIIDATFTRNRVISKSGFFSGAGGAVYNDAFEGRSSPQITNTVFTGNSAVRSGGAIYSSGDSGVSNLQITNAVFTSNSAEFGGAVYNDSGDGESNPLIINATFTENSASTDGGAIYNNRFTGTVDLQVKNTILWANSAEGEGDEIYNYRGSVTLTHTLIEGGVNGPGVSESPIIDGGNNRDANPLFVDERAPAGPDGVFGTADDGLRLIPGSPALDAGDNVPFESGGAAETVTTDLLDEDRIQDNDGDGTPTVSLGAYERGADPVPNQAIVLDGTGDYVTANGVSDALAGAGTFTMEAWVYPTQPNGQQGLTAFNTGTGDNLNLLFYRDGQFEYVDDDAGRTASRNAFPAGQWYHVAFTVDASDTATLYVNGRREATLTTPVRPVSGGRFSIGHEWDGNTPSDFFEGRVDEVRIWSEARTQAEIQQGMTTSLGEDNTLGDAFDLSSLEAYYRFEGLTADATGSHAGIPEGAPSYTGDVAQSTAEDALIVRVNAAVSGGAGNGTTWSDAHADLQDGLTGTGPENDIWIAEGTYTPSKQIDTDDPRTATFEIAGDQDGLKIYGGFESGDAFADRNPADHPTILSGDIGTTGDASDNAYHVVVFNGGNGIGSGTFANITADTELNGVTITGGHANGDDVLNKQGGGLFCDGSSSGNECSPTLSNTIFDQNVAEREGGALFNDGLFSGESSPILTNVTFTGNSARSGAGMYSRGAFGVSSPVITEATFEGNVASVSGGGMYLNSDSGVSNAQITDAIFTGNEASLGAAGYINGADGEAAPQITNAVVTENATTSSIGAFYFYGDGGSIAAEVVNSIFADNGDFHVAFNDGNAGESPTFINSIFTGATDSAFNIQFYDNGQTPMQVVNSILWGNGAGDIVEASGAVSDPDQAVEVSYSIVEEARYAEGSGDPNAGTGNANTDPLFVDAVLPAGPDDIFGTDDDGIRIANGSPAVDAGDNSAVPSGVSTDLLGDPRIQDGNDDGTATVSLGAYEEPGLARARSVTIAGTDSGDDSGWRILGVPYTGTTAGDLELTHSAGVSAPRFGQNVMQMWDDAAGAETPTGAYTPANASTSLPAGTGFLFYFRDDAAVPVDDAGVTVSVDRPATALRFAGDVTVSGLSASARWHLLANPYPTGYALGALQSNGQALVDEGFQNDAQIYDVTVPGGAGWRFIDTSSDVLSAWQGAFIERTAPGNGATSVTFGEDGRAAGVPFIGTMMQGPASDTPDRAMLRFALTAHDGGDSPIARDEAIGIRFHEDASTGFDPYDTSKMNPLETPYAIATPLGTGRDGSEVGKAVESRPYLQAGDAMARIPVQLYTAEVPNAATLTVSVQAYDLPAEWAAEIVDTKGTAASSDERVVPLGPDHEIEIALSDLQDYSTEVAPLRVQVAPSEEALPVELSRFDAQRESDESITLQWQTLSETNNAGFEVQRRVQSAHESADASNVETPQVETPQWDVSTDGSWHTIATLDGAGTTDQPQSYRFEDTDLPYAADSLRYRLRQVDTDGTESFSEAITIARQVTQAELLPTYPNPAQAQATVRYAVPTRQNVRITLYDMLGRRVRTVVDTETAGRTEQTLDVSSLASGTYFLRLQVDNASVDTQRLTIIR